MSRVLFVQTSFQPPSGGHGVGAWMVEALRPDHEVSLLTWDTPDFAAIDRFFGTRLSLGSFRLYAASAVLRAGLDLSPFKLDLLKHSYLTRLCRKWAPYHDVIVTAGNEADFGQRGIQYIHFPRLNRRRPAADPQWYYRSLAIVDAYHRLSGLVAGFSPERMKANCTLVNSRWTAAHVRQLHGIESRVLRPPIAGDFPDVPWGERKNGFVCVGRIAPEKELDTIIDIVAALRGRGHDLPLRIAGTTGTNGYCARIRQRVQQNSNWIELDENLSRDELLRLIARQRYGIHGMQEEHYGMAVAEMVRAGCITFVPRGGGQVEIVGDDERLLYATPEEAIQKIDAVLRSTRAQDELRPGLAVQAAQLSSERFVREWRQIVQDFEKTNAVPGERAA